MIGTIGDPRLVIAVGDACGAASRRVRERMEQALKKEKDGQAACREEVFTEEIVDVIDDMGRALAEEIGSLSMNFANEKPPKGIALEFSSEKAPQGEENDFGLDLGLRIVINTPGYVMNKAILVQCKRMYGGAASGGCFPKLHDDGEKQAVDMLKVSPASFFFLFNAGDPRDLLKMMGPGLTYPLWPLWDWADPGLVWGTQYFDPGVAVLPATRVLAMSKAAKESGVGFPTNASDLLPGSVPLGHFIASLFAPCFVGDVRTPVLQLATAPRLRDSVSGVDADVPAIGPMKKKTRRFQKLSVTKTGTSTSG